MKSITNQCARCYRIKFRYRKSLNQPLGAYLFLMLFGWGLIRGGLIRRGLIKLFDKYRIKSSLSKLLFSILLQEQSKFEHQSLSKSSTSSGVGTYSRRGFIDNLKFQHGGLFEGGAYARGGANSRIYVIQFSNFYLDSEGISYGFDEAPLCLVNGLVK